MSDFEAKMYQIRFRLQDSAPAEPAAKLQCSDRLHS